MYSTKHIFNTNKATAVFFFSLLILHFSPVVRPAFVSAAESNTDNRISFVWAFGAIRNKSGSPESVNINRDITLTQGDQIKMLVQLTSHCFVYVIYTGSRGGMSLLYPQRGRQYQPGENVVIPQGDEWFTLDEHTGKETFCLLASKTRLTSLEHLLETYHTLDSTGKSHIKNQISALIRRIKRQHKKSLCAAAERPVLIGGAFRGLKKKTSDLAITKHSIKISAQEFYSRTFIINHE